MKTEANGRMLAKTDKSKDQGLAPVDVMANRVSQMKGAMEQVLPKHMTADRMLRVAIMAVRTTPHLAECSSASVISCFMACSMLGLEPNSPLKQAYLVPYWSTKLNGYECQLLIDYRGKIDLARRSGEIANIQAHAVYQGDLFDYELGLNPTLKHKPSGDPKRVDPKNLTHCYCVVRLKEQGTEPIFVVLSRAEIELRRMRGASGKKGRDGKPISTPWDTDYEKMAKKTAVHECMTWAPRSAEMAMADDIEERAERGATILPTLPESITSAMLESGMATERDMNEPIDVEPETQTENVQSKKGNGSAQPAAAATPEPKVTQPTNDEAGHNINPKTGHIFPSEIKDVKTWAKERGDEQLVSACEAALTGDDAAKAVVIAARDALPQREVE
ncbi:MAG: recombinase RecT [Bryobacteraceae bacterium]